MLNSGVIGSNNDLACSCHICGDSKTKRKKRLHLFTKDNVHDSVHCFNCGYSSSAYNYFKEFHSEYFSQYKLELNKIKRVVKMSILDNLKSYQDFSKVVTEELEKRLFEKAVEEGYISEINTIENMFQGFKKMNEDELGIDKSEYDIDEADYEDDDYNSDNDDDFDYDDDE